MNKKEKILVTGSSGFIGMHLCHSLLEASYEVIGVDNMNDYYSISLKEARLETLSKHDSFTFTNIDISNLKMLEKIFKEYKPSKVVNLAAQAGVRYSLEDPHVYINSNIVGFMNILECVRYNDVETLVYASSSSVYGRNKKLPFSEIDIVNKPSSIYGVTKLMNELMAQSYSHLYNMRTTGLRFFTAYGPWGRPDMAISIFTDKILKNKKIPVFNNGNMFRDFTYIDDIVNGIVASLKKSYKCEVFNLGRSKKEKLIDMIKIIELNLNKKASINFKNIQLGDIKETYADIIYSKEKLDFDPKISLDEGIPKFIKWYKDYHSL
tara:strand:- start:3973 stop:4938 length:966 start_codon:yes stop_codon:yes gene_type:complete